MPKVEMDLETNVAPEGVRRALLDFTDRRPEIWPGLTAGLYEVYEVGETTAEIKEGTKSPGMSFWARERYDFSDPARVTWTVVESNFCAPGSSVSAAIAPRAGGGSRIHVTWDRTPITFGGRVAAFLIRATKGKPVAASFAKAMTRLEGQAAAEPSTPG